jgi:hypothetical protein
MKTRVFQTLSISIALIAILFANNSYAQTVRASNAQIRGLLTRLETKTDAFRMAVERNLDRSMIDNTNREDRIMDLINDFEMATDRLRGRFDSRLAIGNETNEVLSAGQRVDAFMRRNALNRNVENQWVSIRTDLDLLARYYSVSWNWDRPVGGPVYTVPYTATEAQVRNLLARIENKTDLYKRQMDRGLDRTFWNNTRAEDSIANYVANFETATDRLRDRFSSNQSVTADANEVLSRAIFIDRFMRDNRVSRAAQNRWNTLRNDLNTLASYYRVSWNWNQPLPTFPGTPTYPGQPYGRFDQRLTGTYRLNDSLSDNVANVVARELASIAANRRAPIQRNLERRLASPEMIAIEKVNSNVMMASSNAPRVDFSADGVARTETNNRGRTITTTVRSTSNDLVIEYVGDRSNDFYITMTPINNDRLRITRRVYLENQNEMITVNSVYDKTDAVARWNTVNSRPNWDTSGGTTPQDFYVPNGTRVSAILRNEIDTRASQVGDRFTLEVTSPSQYRGAIIEGRVSEASRSGRFTGRANIELALETIRLTNGQTYRFAGIIDSVTAMNGDNISVNNEGVIRDSNRTTQTVTRAGIGAVLGAIIGAIAGGGEGAAIGAGVGAGAGAGSVLITGRDNIELGTGSTFQITASSPANLGRLN